MHFLFIQYTKLLAFFNCFSSFKQVLQGETLYFFHNQLMYLEKNWTNLLQVPSLAMTGCKSLLLLVQIAFLNSEGRREESGERKVMEWQQTEIHAYFHCATSSILCYLSTRNCLFHFFYVCMIISEASGKYSHLIGAAVRGVIGKRTRVYMECVWSPGTHF